MYILNEPTVMMAKIDDVAIFIQNETFCYYSPNSTAMPLIEALLAGYDAEEVRKAALAVGYFLGENNCAFEQLLEQMTAEKLIVAAETKGKEGMPVLPPPADKEEPVLFRYEDLQDMLALDPIYEV